MYLQDFIMFFFLHEQKTQENFRDVFTGFYHVFFSPCTKNTQENVRDVFTRFYHVFISSM